MSVIIEECTDADMTRAFELLSVAFGHEHPYIESVFPAHETADGRRIGGERLLEFRKADPFATNIKALDPETGKMIGHARWIVCDGALAPEFELSGDYWDSQEQKEFASWMYSQYLVPRREAIKNSGGHIVCRIMKTPLISTKLTFHSTRSDDRRSRVSETGDWSRPIEVGTDIRRQARC
jgi:hypothetical protein